MNGRVCASIRPETKRPNPCYSGRSFSVTSLNRKIVPGSPPRRPTRTATPRAAEFESPGSIEEISYPDAHLKVERGRGRKLEQGNDLEKDIDGRIMG